jgi:hypothetical protein
MRLALLSLLAILCSSAEEIPKGSHTLLRLINSISTRTAREGDFVYFRTSTPIVSQGGVVVPVDSYVQGVVSHARRGGRVQGTAELAIRIETLTLASGKVVKMNPSLASVDSEGSDQKVVGRENEVKQGTSHGEDAVRIAGTGATGAALGGMVDRSWRGAGIGAAAGSAAGLATVLLTRGREVELKQGTTIDVIFDRSISIE